MNTQIVNHPLKGRIVLALRAFQKGDLVTVGKPVGIAAQRDRHSFQLKEAFHLHLDEPACLLSHSCSWNLGIADNEYGGLNFYASRAIERGEELTWFYGMSEAESIAVPECKCGAEACLGRSYGFKQAPAELQATLVQAGIANYLKAWYSEQNNMAPSRARLDELVAPQWSKEPAERYVATDLAVPFQGTTTNGAQRRPVTNGQTL